MVYEPTSEKQPLTAPSLTTMDSRRSSTLSVTDIKQFLDLADNAMFGIGECNHYFDKLQEAQKQVFEHAFLVDGTARRNRETLAHQIAKVKERLDHVRQIIFLIEPAKPNLSDLDLRNQKFKRVVRSYKDFLEKYINLILESQRFTAYSLENQVRLIYPNIASVDLDKAINSANAVMLQVLLQKGVVNNDKDTRLITHAVQDIHQDLRQLDATLSSLSKYRNEANLIMQRYRRRWPIAIRQGNEVFVINDDLSLLEKTGAGQPVDYDKILHKRELRNRIIASIISIITVLIVLALVISTTLFSDK